MQHSENMVLMRGSETVTVTVATGVSALGDGGVGLTAGVSPVIVAAIVNVALVSVLALANVMSAGTESRAVHARMKATLLAASVPLLLIFGGALIIRILEHL